MKKTLENKYQKLSPIEHIKHRSGMWIGTTKQLNEVQWVWGVKQNKMIKANLKFAPAFLKIFDEVLTNALDESTKNKNLKTIKVSINKEIGEISVYNDGGGIPIEIHKDHNMYLPELIFGNLFTGSNYDDSEGRTGAGMNGLGVKLTNIYSTSFKLEICDGKNKYTQTFKNNMDNKSEPIIKNCTQNGYVKVSFIPDYAKFNMKKLDNNAEALLIKRVYDCIACTDKRVSIWLNGTKIKGNGLQDYVDYFFDEENKQKIHGNFSGKYKKECLDWEWCVIPNDTFEQVSFVNGNSTFHGGTHVNYITNKIIDKLRKELETKKKMSELKPSTIKEKMFIFVKATVINPDFDAQTKGTLKTPVKDFGCEPIIQDTFINKLYKSEIVKDIIEIYETDQLRKLNKTDGKKKKKINIPKLEDAEDAGTIRSDSCTLILTEGDSAKMFAVRGRAVMTNGIKKYGVFPLKGKLLNIRNATLKQQLENEEINNIKQILGLRDNTNYTNTKELRYGKVLILTDADSVTYDTPCLLKNKNTGEIITKQIYEINNTEWINVNNKEYSLCNDYYIWSDNNWTDIKSVMRHKVNKKIYRVLTHTGCVDVTEDHSLLNKEGKIITPLQCSLNTELLHKKCVELNNYNYGITEEYAYALGYFMADGTCTTYSKITQKNGTVSYNSKWSITCINKEPLEELKKIFEDNENYTSIQKNQTFDPLKCDKCFKQFNNNKSLKEHQNIKNDCRKRLRFEIYEQKVSKNSFSEKAGKKRKYVLEAKGLRKDLCIKYRKMFYTQNRQKQVPIEILNSNKEIQQSFINGFYEGDGNKGMRTTDTIQGEHKIQFLGLWTLLQNCDYLPSLNFNNTKLKVYGINMGGKSGRCSYWRPECTIKKIIDVTELYKNTYVYDIETHNHHFHAGIGNLIVKNTDGIHITSLFFNLIHARWPSLLKLNYITTLRTPIIKATKGQTIKEYFTLQDYDEEKDQLNGYKIKYYKGLGTSGAQDAKNCFKRFEELKIDFQYEDNEDDNAILLAFDKDKGSSKIKSDKRKEWLSNYNKDNYIQKNINKVRYKDYIHKELIHFSVYDNQRSVPSLLDGLKPSQRKILYYMLKNNIHKEIKVAQLSGKVSADMGYHHGEMSLNGAIIGMAQNHVGSNNINLLEPKGEFGSVMGSNAASPRYIYTHLSPVTELIYKKEDLPLLTYINDDGMIVEPEWFIPILPMILVNGCEGIGTGFSTYIPMYNPIDIINHLFSLLNTKTNTKTTTKTNANFNVKDKSEKGTKDKTTLNELIPYYKNFNGKIEKESDNKFTITGSYERISDTEIQITELPIGITLESYKLFLDEQSDNKNKKRKFELEDYTARIADPDNDGYSFILQFKNKEYLTKQLKRGIPFLKELKLKKSISINNMHLFDDNLQLQKYDINKIIRDFYDIRLEFYDIRRDYMIKTLKRELKILTAKITFITEFIEGTLTIMKQSKESIITQLENKKYYKVEHSYDYLIMMPVISLTRERIDKLQTDINVKTNELKELENKTEKDLWIEDLNKLKKALINT